MLTQYAKALIARKDAIDGTIKRQVAIGHVEKQARLSALAVSYINRHDDRLSTRKVRLEWDKQSHFTIALREAGDMLRKRDAKKVIIIKRAKITWLARARNCFSGKVRTLRIKSVSAESAKRKAMQSIRKFETLVDVTEKRFAVQ